MFDWRSLRRLELSTPSIFTPQPRDENDEAEKRPTLRRRTQDLTCQLSVLQNIDIASPSSLRHLHISDQTISLAKQDLLPSIMEKVATVASHTLQSLTLPSSISVLFLSHSATSVLHGILERLTMLERLVLPLSIIDPLTILTSLEKLTRLEVVDLPTLAFFNSYPGPHPNAEDVATFLTDMRSLKRLGLSSHTQQSWGSAGEDERMKMIARDAGVELVTL